eukprot:jgi/Mesen1/8103/ME000435S07278
MLARPPISSGNLCPDFLPRLTIRGLPRRNYNRVIMASSSALAEYGGSPDKRRAVVCGAGVIGVCTAYFLSKTGVDVTIIEKSGVASAASGKAGGFLALDWCSGPVAKLAQASFKLHEQLSEELKNDGFECGYRKVETLSLKVQESKDLNIKRSQKAGLPGWIDGPIGTSGSIGNQQTTAQVHPKLFTQAVLDAAVKKHGVKLVMGEVQGIQVVDSVDGSGGGEKVAGVLVDGKVVPADIAVVAMGPWSSRISLVKQLTHISGLKANSIVLKPRDEAAITAHMLFLQYRTKEGKSLDPEIYPRPTGEVYVCGFSEDAEVPDDPLSILPSKGAPEKLHHIASTVSSRLAEALIEAQQACFLPCSEDGNPVIGPIPGAAGAYVATGHSCWGILNAPATGASLAELIVDGSSRLVDLRPLYPARFQKVLAAKRK